MEKYFSVGEASKACGLTSETLRHYDRIGLVKPSVRDEWTGWRYYTREDVIRLQTVKALRTMELSLERIKTVLGYDDLEEIVAFLDEAKKRADEKIAALIKAKEKIQLARDDYARKLLGRSAVEGHTIRRLPKRVILLSDTLTEPSLDNLWNYLAHFYNLIDPEKFSFEDLAGVYTAGGVSRMFAVCRRYEDAAGLVTLPEGEYLSCDCGGDEREETLSSLVREAWEICGEKVPFTVEKVVVSGILSWTWQIEVPLFGGQNRKKEN